MNYWDLLWIPIIEFLFSPSDKTYRQLFEMPKETAKRMYELKHRHYIKKTLCKLFGIAQNPCPPCIQSHRFAFKLSKCVKCANRKEAPQ